MSKRTPTDLERVEEIKERAREIENYRIYYTMKLMKVTPLTDKAVERMRMCLAIHEFGYPITTNLLGNVEGTERRNGSYRLARPLHYLGDKNCLILRRGGAKSKEHRWHVSPTFLRYYNGDFRDQKEE